jgi:hypothetical protein
MHGWLLQMIGYYKWKQGDNMNILKLQKKIIWLLFFNNLRKRTMRNLEMAPDRTILHLFKTKSQTLSPSHELWRAHYYASATPLLIDGEPT